MLLKTACLMILLIWASIADVRTKKIPNVIFYIGMASSILFDIFLYQRSTKELLISYAGAFLVFLFGSFRLLGLGDIKIWMVITAYYGIITSSLIICMASALLIIVAVIKDKSRVKAVLLGIFQVINRQKIVLAKQEAYAFIPYVTFITFCMGIYMVVI